jgi:Tol biopolymer transport system component
MFSNLAALAVVTALVAAPAGARSPMPGELAVVSSGKLVLVAGGKPSQVVPGAGAVSEPAWSPDGKWVAFLRGGSALWAVHANGAGAHRVSPAGADVSEFAWVPGGQGEKLAFSVFDTASYFSKIFLAAPNSTKLRELGAYSDLIGFSVAPSGSALAVSYRQGPPPAPGKAPTWKGVLAVVPLAGGPGRAVYTLPEGGYVLLRPGWWPDGKGLLFWDDPAGSASIAADGLALDSLDLATGRVSTLATTLTYSNWVSWSPSGNTVALVAGGDRIIWDSGKHLVLCAMPAARCHSVPLPSSNLMSLDPTWTASGSLVYDLMGIDHLAS